jgi:hypothetical protein
MGDYAKAEPLLRRALAILEETLGPKHPLTAGSLNNLAILDIDLGKAKGDLEFAVRAEMLQETQLGNILSFTSEQQRLAFQEKSNPFTLVATGLVRSSGRWRRSEYTLSLLQSAKAGDLLRLIVTLLWKRLSRQKNG